MCVDKQRKEEEKKNDNTHISYLDAVGVGQVHQRFLHQSRQELVDALMAGVLQLIVTMATKYDREEVRWSDKDLFLMNQRKSGNIFHNTLGERAAFFDYASILQKKI